MPYGTPELADPVFENKRKFLIRLERSAARQALNTLDLNYPPGPHRDAARKAFLDALAEFRREIEKWLKSESEHTPDAEEKASTRSRSN